MSNIQFQQISLAVVVLGISIIFYFNHQSAKKIAAELHSQQERLSAIENCVGRSKVDIGEDVRSISGKIESIRSDGSGIKANPFLAKRSAELGHQAQNNGDTDLALVYFLSAINHNPSDVQNLKYYEEVLRTKKNATQEEWEKWKSILDLCLYQVHPDAINEVLAMSQGAEQWLKNNAEIANATVKPLDLAAELKAILDDPNSQLTSFKGSRSRLKLLEQLTEEASSNGKTEIISDLDGALEKTRTIVTAYESVEGLQNLLKNVEPMVATGREDVVPLLRTAEVLLGQLYALNSSDLSANVVQERDSAANDYKNLLVVFTKAQSEKNFKELKYILDAWKMRPLQSTAHPALANKEKGAISKNIVELEDIVNDASQHLGQIQNPEIQRQGQDEIKRVLGDDSWLKSERLRLYNLWSIKLLDNAFYYKINSNDDLGKVFDDLKVIDPGLLNPDAMNLYQAVVEQLLSNEVNNQIKEKVTKDPIGVKHEMRKKLAYSPKIKLEQF
ncbi:MAG: hypothetical protein PHD76_05495 [Methylacidiphilales bacterium]|nr:hypothetical protein [Candidatus Methylacidiphilales bacterium]